MKMMKRVPYRRHGMWRPVSQRLSCDAVQTKSFCNARMEVHPGESIRQDSTSGGVVSRESQSSAELRFQKPSTADQPTAVLVGRQPIRWKYQV